MDPCLIGHAHLSASEWLSRRMSWIISGSIDFPFVRKKTSYSLAKYTLSNTNRMKSQIRTCGSKHQGVFCVDSWPTSTKNYEIYFAAQELRSQYFCKFQIIAQKTHWNMICLCHIFVSSSSINKNPSGWFLHMPKAQILSLFSCAGVAWFYF